jgi:hypothetical protein
MKEWKLDCFVKDDSLLEKELLLCLSYLEMCNEISHIKKLNYFDYQVVSSGDNDDSDDDDDDDDVEKEKVSEKKLEKNLAIFCYFFLKYVWSLLKKLREIINEVQFCNKRDEFFDLFNFTFTSSNTVSFPQFYHDGKLC